MRETFARAPSRAPRGETRSTRSGPSRTRGSTSSTTGLHRLVLTVGYSEVGAFAEVLQSTGECVDGRVVRRTAGEALDRDSERCDDRGGGDARLLVAHTPAGAAPDASEEPVLDRSQVSEPA